MELNLAPMWKKNLSPLIEAWRSDGEKEKEKPEWTEWVAQKECVRIGELAN